VEDIAKRFATTKVRGLMIGRAAMTSPWLFRQAKHYLQTGEIVAEPSVEERWAHVLRHCRTTVEESGHERFAMTAMRARLMAYSKGMPSGRLLRGQLQQIQAVSQLEELAQRHIRMLAAAAEQPVWV